MRSNIPYFRTDRTAKYNAKLSVKKYPLFFDTNLSATNAMYFVYPLTVYPKRHRLTPSTSRYL